MLFTCTSDSLVDTITSNGVTWTLNTPYESGQFITGDWWVVGPVTVVSVSPGWTGLTNGSMVNPVSSATVQGYDNRLSPTYPNMNFAFDNSVRKTFPLDLVAGESLISTIGKGTPIGGGGATHISAAAVLTVLASAPAANAFRPPYVGTTKTVWTEDDVDYDLLPGLATPSGCTLINMSASGDYLNKVWLSHGNQMTWHSQIHPEDHNGGIDAANGYPFEMLKRVSRMALACLLDIPEAHSIANRLIQYGIDLQASLSGNGFTWSRTAGFGSGRKWPILFAKTMLGAGWTIPYYISGSSGPEKFQEDGFTYIGSGGNARYGEVCDTVGYSASASFSGSNHNCRPVDGVLDQWKLFYNGDANAGLYEITNTARCWVGQALAARLMESAAGTMTAWGNPTFFDYVDRWVSTISEEAAAHSPPISVASLSGDFKIDANKYGGDGTSKFMKRMWEVYR